MELIDVEAKVDALLFGDITAAHGGGLEFHNEDHPEQLGVEVPGSPLAQVYQQDFLIIHNIAQVEGALGLADDIAHHLVAQEGAEFTDKPGRDFAGFVGALRRWELLSPEIHNGFIGDVF